VPSAPKEAEELAADVLCDGPAWAMAKSRTTPMEKPATVPSRRFDAVRWVSALRPSWLLLAFLSGLAVVIVASFRIERSYQPYRPEIKSQTQRNTELDEACRRLGASLDQLAPQPRLTIHIIP
jgi:hypothetical protein